MSHSSHNLTLTLSLTIASLMETVYHYYAMPHTIPFGMYHVVCNGISQGHVVCFFAQWYAFLTIWYVLQTHRQLQVRISKG